MHCIYHSSKMHRNCNMHVTCHAASMKHLLAHDKILLQVLCWSLPQLEGCCQMVFSSIGMTFVTFELSLSVQTTLHSHSAIFSKPLWTSLFSKTITNTLQSQSPADVRCTAFTQNSSSILYIYQTQQHQHSLQSAINWTANYLFCRCFVWRAGEAEALALDRNRKPVLDMHSQVTEERVCDGPLDYVTRCVCVSHQIDSFVQTLHVCIHCCSSCEVH